MAVKKPKVIAFRLDEYTHKVLEWDRVNELTRNPQNQAVRTTSTWVAYLIEEMLETTKRLYETEQKRIETQAKRRATREAKKAAANDPQ